MKKKNKNEKFLDTNAVIKELAERAGFTIGDTKLFLDAFEGLFADSIEQGIDIDIRGFLHLYIQDIPEFEGVNAHESKKQGFSVRQVFPPSKRIILKLGVNMRDIVRSPEKRKIKNSRSTRDAILKEKTIDEI